MQPDTNSTLTPTQPAHNWLDDYLDDIFGVAEEKARRRQERVEACGSFVMILDHQTQKHKCIRRWCDNWRECSTCWERRMEEFIPAFQQALAEGPIWSTLVTDSAEERALKRKAGDTEESYSRFPAAPGTFILTREPLTSQSIQFPTPDPEKMFIFEMTLEGILNTPEGKRITGKLIPPSPSNPRSPLNEKNSDILSGPAAVINKEAEMSEDFLKRYFNTGVAYFFSSLSEEERHSTEFIPVDVQSAFNKLDEMFLSELRERGLDPQPTHHYPRRIALDKGTFGKICAYGYEFAKQKMETPSGEKRWQLMMRKVSQEIRRGKHTSPP